MSRVCPEKPFTQLDLCSNGIYGLFTSPTGKSFSGRTLANFITVCTQMIIHYEDVSLDSRDVNVVKRFEVEWEIPRVHKQETVHLTAGHLTS